MKTHTLGSQGLTVSRLGLGCMGMSEFYGETNDQESTATLHRAVELGVTHFDTADVYGKGHNEILLGKALKEKRQKLIIATKCGIVRDDNDPHARGINGSPAYVRSCCEKSLKRLDMDHIDLFYIHRIDSETPIEDTIGELSKLVQEGKIRYIGLSEASADIIQRAHKIHPLTAIQTEYSLWTRTPEKEILPLCNTLGIGFVAYSPIGRGFLTGKLDTQQLAKDDFRRNLPRFQAENLEYNQRIVETVQELASSKNCTPAQLALAWVLARGEDVTAIPGTRRIKYLEENMKAAEIEFTQKDVEFLNQHLPAAQGERYTQAAMNAYQLKE